MKKLIKFMVLAALIIMCCVGVAFAAEGAVGDVGLADFGFAPVAGIVVICYLVAALLKATSIDNKWLPVICGLCGGLLGVAAMYIMPDYPGGDYITSVAIGIVSGLAATGINQIYKQLSGK